MQYKSLTAVNTELILIYLDFGSILLHLLDKTVKYPEDNPSIGILLCKSKSKLTVEYALELVNNPIGVSTYHYRQLPKEIAQYLPTEDDFNRIIEQYNEGPITDLDKKMDGESKKDKPIE